MIVSPDVSLMVTLVGRPWWQIIDEGPWTRWNRTMLPVDR